MILILPLPARNALRLIGLRLAAIVAATSALLSSSLVHASTFATLHAFNPGVIPAQPQSNLVQAGDGNFYGTSTVGGAYGEGSIYKVTSTGTVMVMHSFYSSTDGAYPGASLVLGSDGDLYGTTTDWGAGSNGTVFKMTTGGSFSTLYAFTSGGGIGYSLMQGSDGNFYGTSGAGGANDAGTIFEVTSGGAYSLLYTFTGGPNSGPTSPMVEDANGNFYGTTPSGGNGDGTIFKLAPGNVYSTLASFTAATGVKPSGNVVLASDGKLYGTCQSGGGTYNGTVFCATLAGALSTVYNFDSNSSVPMAGLVEGSAGTFYGTTSQGGTNSHGTVFSVTSSGTFTPLWSFGDSDGWDPVANLILAGDGNLYGTTQYGSDNAGSVFKITTGGSLTRLAKFSYAEGANPDGGLTVANDGNYYGTCSAAGSAGFGEIFNLTANGVYSSMRPFNYAFGYQPSTHLLLGSDGALYGTTNGIPFSGPFFGDVFKVTTANAFTDLHDFAKTEGEKASRLVEGSDGNFYGTTYYGDPGPGNDGTIFQVTPGGVLTVIHRFSGSDGADPAAGLIDGHDGYFYGMTTYGGANGYGTVFKVDTSGTVTKLYSFSGSGTNGEGTELVLGSDGNLYGSNPNGGTIIFKLAKAGQYTKLATLSGGFVSPLIQAADGNFYGTEQAGGSSNMGEVFAMTPTGTVSVLHAFSGPDGENPFGGLTQVAPYTFIGTTIYGGLYGSGAAFKLVVTAQTPRNLTATANGDQVNLAWTGGVATSSYNIYRGTSPGGESSTPYVTGLTAASYQDTAVTSGTLYYYTVVGVNTNGTSVPSTEAKARPVLAMASLLTTDTTTHGEWKGVHGSDGYNVISDTSSNNPQYPGYATLLPSHNSSCLWTAASTAGYALQQTQSGSPNHVAGAWYATSSFTIDVNLTDGVAHQVALYFIDYGSTGRVETVTITDPATGHVLDSQSVGGFAAGLYKVWTIQGHVSFSLTRSQGPNVVVSGLFFGAGSGPTAPPTPINFVVGAGNARTTLNWSSSSGATSYLVYRSTAAGAEGGVPYMGSIQSTSFTDTAVTPGVTYFYQVEAANAIGGSAASAEAHVRVPPATVSFVKIDTTTQGNWKTVYGLDGYNIIGDASVNNPSYPAYAVVTPSDYYPAIWTSSSTAAYALQAAATGSKNRVAGAWWNTTSMYIDVNLTDANSHQVALYLLDWASAGRNESITVSDAVTHTVLDTRTASSFAAGSYYVWNATGNVVFTISRASGPNAVVSGLFFK